MVIEYFRPGQAPNIYRRLAERGRMAPQDVVHLHSWVGLELERYSQVMEAESEDRVRAWRVRWAGGLPAA